jgi:hypothetical protein
MVGLQGLFSLVMNISPQLGFDLRTVQAVASPYTDWAIQTQNESNNDIMISEKNIYI